MNRAASALGKLAKGKPKKFSAEELKKRSVRLAKARKKRWREKRLPAVAGLAQARKKRWQKK
jgi:hypothetical protein